VEARLRAQNLEKALSFARRVAGWRNSIDSQNLVADLDFFSVGIALRSTCVTSIDRPSFDSFIRIRTAPRAEAEEKSVRVEGIEGGGDIG
jgi:hypothetical protein